MLFPEQILPGELIGRAILSGSEYGWSFDDLPAVLGQAHAHRLAIIGGQIQFWFPDGTCELYWQNADASPRSQGEPWCSYVDRTHDEVRAGLKRLPNREALIVEGIERFPFLKAKAQDGANLRQALCFICYFEAEVG